MSRLCMVFLWLLVATVASAQTPQVGRTKAVMVGYTTTAGCEVWDGAGRSHLFLMSGSDCEILIAEITGQHPFALHPRTLYAVKPGQSMRVECRHYQRGAYRNSECQTTIGGKGLTGLHGLGDSIQLFELLTTMP